VKIEDCWVIRREAKVKPIMIPRYFPRSPISIFRAMEYMESAPAKFETRPGKLFFPFFPECKAGLYPRLDQTEK
jgi:hypothetical protein